MRARKFLLVRVEDVDDGFPLAARLLLPDDDILARHTHGLAGRIPERLLERARFVREIAGSRRFHFFVAALENTSSAGASNPVQVFRLASGPVTMFALGGNIDASSA